MPDIFRYGAKEGQGGYVSGVSLWRSQGPAYRLTFQVLAFIFRVDFELHETEDIMDCKYGGLWWFSLYFVLAHVLTCRISVPVWWTREQTYLGISTKEPNAKSTKIDT